MTYKQQKYMISLMMKQIPMYANEENGIIVNTENIENGRLVDYIQDSQSKDDYNALFDLIKLWRKQNAKS